MHSQETPASERERPLSTAADFNRKVLKKITNRLRDDPTVDIAKLLPSHYSHRLVEARKADCPQDDTATGQETAARRGIVETPVEGEEPGPAQATITKDPSEGQGRVKILFPLAPEVERLLNGILSDQDPMERKIQELIQSGRILFQSKASSGLVVVKCSSNVVIKVIRSTEDLTEASTMQFLQDQIPEIPAPRLLGAVMFSPYSYIFMTFLPGTQLDSIWPQLSAEQKSGIITELDDILQKLRLPLPPETPLGGVGGEGCKDTRRHTRTCHAALFSHSDFLDFIFSNPHFGGEVYIRFLRELWGQESSSSIVFTHGDFMPLNILVQLHEDGYCHVSGLVDWERSGWYPEWWETVKATNCLSTMTSGNDWALYLPPSISPMRYRLPWSLDRLWGAHVA